MFLLLFSIRDLFSTFHSLEGSTEFDPKPHIVSLLFTSCGCPHNFVETPHFLHHSLPVRVPTFCSDSRFYDSQYLCPNTTIFLDISLPTGVSILLSKVQFLLHFTACIRPNNHFDRMRPFLHFSSTAGVRLLLVFGVFSPLTSCHASQYISFHLFLTFHPPTHPPAPHPYIFFL